jgi:cytochrome c553
MPPIVAKGDESRGINACGFCHLPNGLGRPENGNISGLPVEYFRQQIVDFKNGGRVTSDPRKTNTATMTEFAKKLTDEEVNQAAAYFAAVKLPPDWIKVVETTTVPKTGGTGNWLTVIEGAGAGTEAIGNRIVEVPVDQDAQEKWRNPRLGFIAYVPTGSVAKGKQLAESGGDGRFTACTVCHGQDLRGLGPVPPLAGRSPSYLARQLYDMQTGNRFGSWTPLMSAVVAALEPSDLLNISAYAASLKP